ncbi:MAG: hypothetical protein COV35_09080 [Alphaproteobacteria bacterium CG11_big_fil_rev_8_21_14_0_20_39_49]|nr:MAG: hypothetical protein COV35_09080 [Alphaproteobacteria bacterium CG11_big_fil_rev_8_21_14_0_20_39_49]
MKKMVKEKKLALVTRPYIDSKKFEEDLAKIGVESFIEPFLEIQFYQNANKVIRPYLDSCQLMVATSANAVRAVGYTKKDIVAVGEKTAQVAKELGFEKVFSSKGNVENLKKYIEKNFSPRGGGLLYISGDIIANDLKPEGFKLTRVVVYSSMPVKKISSKCKKYFEDKKFDYVFLFSKRTAEVFAEHAGKYDFKNTTCFCLSENIKYVISKLNFKEVIVLENFDMKNIANLV